MDFFKTNWIGLVAIIIAIIAFSLPQTQNDLGAFGTRFPSGIAVGSGASVDTLGTLSVGDDGTQVTEMIVGKCTLIMSSFTVTASTTAAADCAVTGVVSGDTVFAQFATSTTAFLGWSIGQVSASSTSGFITMRVANNIGVASVIPASLASSSVQYLIVR